MIINIIIYYSISDDDKNEDKAHVAVTSNKQSKIKILAVPLEKEIVDLLEVNGDILKV